MCNIGYLSVEVSKSECGIRSNWFWRGENSVSEVVLPTTSDVLHRSAIFGSLDHATVTLRHAIELLVFP